MMEHNAKRYALLYGSYLIYSLSLVSARFAADHPLISFTAMALYGFAFLLLGIFAVIWQQVLKQMPLTTAYANRAITIFYAMIWGALLFSEKVSWNMILGSIIIVCGVVLVVFKRE